MATLKSLVDETTNIKNELKTCHTNLKNNLIEKGVESSDTDKMSSLIDKIKDIYSFNSVLGNTNIVGCFGTNLSTNDGCLLFDNLTYDDTTFIQIQSLTKGSLSIVGEIGGGYARTKDFTIIQYDSTKNTIKDRYTISLPASSNFVSITKEFVNVDYLDIFAINCKKTSANGNSLEIRNLEFKCDFI